MKIEALRTPDERFANLPGFGFATHYVADLPRCVGLRMHYLDEGREGDPVALCLHGQPTWSYLYRRMVPGLVAARYRVVAPDLFGFGRSDKPVHEAIYTFEFHREALIAFVRALDLRRITLVCQDWGGLLGLTLPMEMPERFEGLLVMNTTLASGDRPLSPGFVAWRDWNNANPDMAIGKLMARACPHLSAAEAAAYDAPFPDATYKAGVRRFPNLVPDRPDAGGAAISRRARDWWRSAWHGRTAMAVGMTDPVLGPPVMADLRLDIHGCPPPVELAAAGHFVQEWGDAVLAGALPLLR
jgi:pimeloyl-ACP methyl ester carboxylesterase